MHLSSIGKCTLVILGSAGGLRFVWVPCFCARTGTHSAICKEISIKFLGVFASDPYTFLSPKDVACCVEGVATID